jgi:hypothetical protein
MQPTARFCAALAAALLATAARADEDLPPPVGTIDFYGLGPIPRTEAMAQLPFQLGDRLARSSPKRKSDAMARALGVAHVDFSFICCSPDGKVEAYVGIERRGTKPLEYNAAPSGNLKLPADLLAAHAEFEKELIVAVRNGQAAEDDSQGHALSTYPPLRAQQHKFIAFARAHTDVLREVLANAADARLRAVAAVVLGYAPDKRAVVGPLSHAALDADEGVRNDATRALGVIADYALAHPELGIRIDAAPFIGMLNSVVWTDRNKGSFLLRSLSATREPALLEKLRRDALPALTEMCGWTNLGHAWSSCLILARVLGMSEELSEPARAALLERARKLLEQDADVGAGGRNPPSLELGLSQSVNKARANRTTDANSS